MARTIARGRGLVSIALCALAAHAVLYRSVSPGGAMHGYFAWYEPLVAGLTAAAMLAMGVVVVAAALGRLRPNALLPAPEEQGGLQVARLARSGLVFLLLQETLERSFAEGHAAVPSFAPSTWLLVLASLAFFAALLVLAGRLGARIVRLVLAGSPRSAASALAVLPPRARTFSGRRNPLADRRGLRAPPLLAG